MDEIRVLSDRKTKAAYRWLTAGAGALLAAIGLATGTLYGLACGALLAAAALFYKTTVVKEEGICVSYRIGSFRYEERWGYSELSSIHLEEGKTPDLSALHLTKGAMSKRLFLSADDGQKTIEAAKQKNPQLHIGQAD